MEVLRLLAAIALLLGLIVAPVVGVVLGQRAVANWKLIGLGSAGASLMLMAFYVPRIAAYDGSCVGIYYFGDRWPCSFDEYLGDQVASLIFTAPLALVWALAFWGTYAVCRLVSSDTQTSTVDRELRGPSK